MWFKNRRAKWRKQKREEQERLRKLQEEQCSSTGGGGLGNGVGLAGGGGTTSASIVNLKCIAEDYAAALQIKSDPSYSDADESDLEVA